VRKQHAIFAASPYRHSITVRRYLHLAMPQACLRFFPSFKALTGDR
jgi:hypothetical protein